MRSTGAAAKGDAVEGEDLVRQTSALWSHLQDVGVRSQRGVIDWVSPSVVDVLGYRPEELVGQTAADITHPDDLRGVMTTRELLVDLGVSHLRARVRHKDGSFRWMDIRARTEKDDNREDVMLSTWRDVTDDVAAVEAVEQARDEMRLVAEHASDVVVRGASDGRIEWISRSVRHALGRDPIDLVGTEFRSLVHADQQAAVVGAQQRLTKGEVVSFEAQLAHVDGGWRWFAIRVEPAQDATGRVWRVATWRDIEREVELRASGARGDDRLAAAVRLLPDPLVVLDAVRDESGAVVDLVVAEVNDAAAAYIAQPRAHLVGSRLLDLLPGHAASGMFDRFRELLATGRPIRLEGFAFEHDVRGLRRFDLEAVRVGDSVAYTFRDVTDRVLAAEETAAREAAYRTLTEHAPDIVVRVHDGRFDFVSSAVTSALGWAPGDLIGRETTTIVHPDDVPVLRAERDRLAAGRGPARFRMRVSSVDGTYRWVEAHGETLPSGGGGSVRLAGSWRVIDDQVAAEAELRTRASRDVLTGLANRSAVLEYLAGVASRSARTGTEIAVVYGDVDGFKRVNDTHGHATGDRVLQAVAASVAAVLRRDDMVARLGGDEFLVVLLGVTSLEAAATIAEKLRVAVRSATEPPVTISLGVTLHVRADAPGATVDRADRAMYAAKHAGGDRVVATPRAEP